MGQNRFAEAEAKYSEITGRLSRERGPNHRNTLIAVRAIGSQSLGRSGLRCNGPAGSFFSGVGWSVDQLVNVKSHKELCRRFRPNWAGDSKAVPPGLISLEHKDLPAPNDCRRVQPGDASVARNSPAAVAGALSYAPTGNSCPEARLAGHNAGNAVT